MCKHLLNVVPTSDRKHFRDVFKTKIILQVHCYMTAHTLKRCLNSVVQYYTWYFCTLSNTFFPPILFTLKKKTFLLLISVLSVFCGFSCSARTDRVDFKSLSLIIGFNCTSHLQTQGTLMSKCCQLAQDANEPRQVQEVHPASHCEGRETLSRGCLKDLISKRALLGKRKRKRWGRDEAKRVTLTLEDSRGANLIKTLSVEHHNTASNRSVKWKLKMWGCSV